MIELRYNKDGKLEYRTAITVGQYRGLYANSYAGELQWDEWKIVPSQEQSSVEKNTIPTDPSLRTERITLEVTHDCPTNLRDWHFWRRENLPLNPGESVRVVSELDQIHESCDRVSREEGIKTLTEEIEALNEEINRITEELDTATIHAESWKSLYYSADAGREMKQMSLEKSEARVAELEAANASWCKAADIMNARVADLKSQLESAPAASGNCQGILDGSPAASVAANSPGETVSAEPVAWGVREPRAILWTFTSKDEAYQFRDNGAGRTLVPLFAAPPPARGWLTEEERRDLWEIASLLEDSGWQKCADALLAILARLTPKVKEASND